jgi:hypothetical protein
VDLSSDGTGLRLRPIYAAARLAELVRRSNEVHMKWQKEKEQERSRTHQPLKATKCTPAITDHKPNLSNALFDVNEFPRMNTAVPDTHTRICE